MLVLWVVKYFVSVMIVVVLEVLSFVLFVIEFFVDGWMDFDVIVVCWEEDEFIILVFGDYFDYVGEGFVDDCCCGGDLVCCFDCVIRECDDDVGISTIVYELNGVLEQLYECVKWFCLWVVEEDECVVFWVDGF